MFSKASVIESGIYSKEQLVQERQRGLLQEYLRNREKPLREASSANAQKIFELEQLGLLETYKCFKKLLKWLKDLNINGYNFQIDQPSVNWKQIFESEWLRGQTITLFGWPWYKLEKTSSITKILLTGAFGIFLQTLTQLVAQIQED